MSTLKKSSVGQWIQDIVIILLGCFIYAISINCFTDPNNISPGEVIGIGQLVGDLTGFPKGMFCLIINIPIFLWAFIELNWRGLIKNLFATVALNVLADLTVPILPAYTGDMMIASILAGIAGGVGLGLIFMRGAATGGTDLLATLTKIHISHIPVGKILLCIDGTVVGISAVVYSIGSNDPFAIINGATYAAILIFLETKIIDTMMYGSSAGNGRMMFIVSQKSEEISKRILTEVKRGVTALKSRGAYTSQEGEVLLSAVRKQEVHKIYDIIKEEDENAFVMIGEAGEITGLGFKEFDKELERSEFFKKLSDKKVEDKDVLKKV